MKTEAIIGIVGATGVVGQTLFDLLHDDFFYFSVKKIKLYASSHSKGKIVPFQGQSITIEEVNLDSLLECQAVIFACDAALSQKWIPQLAQKGIICVDKSSAFRMDPKIPLVVPEVNAERLDINQCMVASPNCCAIPLSMVLKPLHTKFGLKRAIVSTYQSVSGAGQAGIDHLNQESKHFLASQDLSCKNTQDGPFPKSMAFNVLPLIGPLQKDGSSDEEQKIIQETQKIIDHKLPMDVTSVRVPTFVGHAMAVTLEFSQSVETPQVIETLERSKGIQVLTFDIASDEDCQVVFGMPREVQGEDDVFVSRIRLNQAFEHGVSLWIACDNLRKGAALNALQIIDLSFKSKNI